MTYTEVDYGSMTPETIDRFGVAQTYQIKEVDDDRSVGRQALFVPRQWDAIPRRLGLSIVDWRHYPYTGHSDYHLLVHDRPILITHYADDRLKIHLDDQPIYQQIHRRRRGQRVLVEEFDLQLWEAAREEIKEAARQRLRERHGQG